MSVNLICQAGSDYRVFRGGGWYYIAGRCRSAFRGGIDPAYRDDFLGFRPAYPAP
jgi:formylglycine-generating enzyme required for sulfatase activity